MNRRWNELPALFLAAFATLLFEVTVTKVFEFSMWANYAYVVISTAMFGLGFSGVLATRWPAILRSRPGWFLPLNTLLTGATMFLALFALNNVPVHLPDAPNGWARELWNLAVVFLALGLPYVLFGLVMTFLMEHRGREANVYYFADLLGAGVGSFAMVPLIGRLEPQGLVVVCAMFCAAAAVLFAITPEWRRPARWAFGVAGLVIVAAVTVAWAPRFAAQYPLKVHVRKRSFNQDVAEGRIEATQWSALSRVDIATFLEHRKRVWISGGVNESAIAKFDGNYEQLRSHRAETLACAREILDYKALPHVSKSNHTVCVIGTSGGEDSFYALAMGARRVVGIEMDPSIARFVTEDYKDYAGGLFTDGDYSELVVDEGRSYLRRAGRKFDVIQQVNNFTPIAFHNGALSLSETYLFTVESFKEFYDTLTDDGIFAVSRYGSIRMLSNAVEMFRRMGMKPEEYAKHLFVCEGGQWVINTFMMKHSPFTRAEIDDLFAF